MQLSIYVRHCGCVNFRPMFDGCPSLDSLGHWLDYVYFFKGWIAAYFGASKYPLCSAMKCQNDFRQWYGCIHSLYEWNMH
jgi:hypothetical protein